MTWASTIPAVDDAALALQAVAGAKVAFAAIYDRYAAPLYDFLCGVLHDRDEAADVLHDSFLTAGSRLHQLRDPAKLRPWLYAIARHHGWRRAKQRARFDAWEDREMSAPTPDAADVAADGAARSELAELVQAAAEGLGPRDRTVLDLHLRHGLEGQELGDALGVSASHAYVVMSRLRDQVERSLGALLVARQGRAVCAELASVLAEWDGKFTTVWRKRVARHADGCAACDRTRKQAVGALALLSAAPAAALPLELRDRVLTDVQLVSHKGKPWHGGRDGFPPPTPDRPRRSRRAAVAVVIAGLALLLGSLVVVEDDPKVGVRAAEPATATTSIASTTSTASTAPLSAAPSTSTTAPATTAGATSTPPMTAPAGTVPGPTTEPPGAVTTPLDRTTLATTTTVAADVTPPALTLPSVDPAQLRAGSACVNRDDRQALVTVRATDPSGVRGVVLIRGNPEAGQAPMVAGPNGTYTATIGPFAGASLTRNDPSASVPLTVRATDNAGNVAESSGRVTIRCDVP